MRNYSRFDGYLSALLQDVYAQPADLGHTLLAMHTLQTLCAIPQGMKNVLDIGCGQGFLRDEFEEMNIKWEGLTIGEDYHRCREAGLPVYNLDMTFTDLPDKSYDLLFARHVLEHSPFPLITLMEWHRIGNGYLVLVAPAPAYWGPRGKNHYAVLEHDHLHWLLERAGWKPIHQFTLTTHDPIFLDAHPNLKEEAKLPNLKDVEYRFLCQRVLEEAE